MGFWWVTNIVYHPNLALGFLLTLSCRSLRRDIKNFLLRQIEIEREKREGKRVEERKLFSSKSYIKKVFGLI